MKELKEYARMFLEGLITAEEFTNKAVVLLANMED